MSACQINSETCHRSPNIVISCLLFLGRGFGSPSQFLSSNFPRTKVVIKHESTEGQEKWEPSQPQNYSVHNVGYQDLFKSRIN